MYEKEDRPGISGTLVGMAILGTIMHSCEPDWKNMSPPEISYDNGKLILSHRAEPDKKYIDLKPFGSLNYVVDSTREELIEREPNRVELDKFGLLYRIALEQGLLKD